MIFHLCIQVMLEQKWLREKLSIVCITSPVAPNGWNWLNKVKDTVYGGPKPIILPLPGPQSFEMRQLGSICFKSEAEKILVSIL